MGEDRDAAQDRVTIQEAARRLGVKEDAVRKRIQRGSMRHEKAEDGRVYVWVDATQDTRRTSQDTTQDAAQDAAQDERLEDLKEQIGYLRRQLDEEREARRRADTIIAQLARANEEQAHTIRELEAPQAPPEDAETTTAPSEDTPPRPSTEGPQAAQGGVSEAEPSLLWERVLAVIVCMLAIASNLLWLHLPGDPSTVTVLVGSALILAWVVFPAVFGFRLGRKLRRLRFWRNVVPGAVLVGLGNALAFAPFGLSLSSSLSGRPSLLFWVLSTLVYVIPSVVVYSFAAILGNALRRRHREALVEEMPSEFPQEAAASVQGWTPRQQAIVGLAGTIISALIGLVGTILAVMLQ